jgi:hypothetical protein
MIAVIARGKRALRRFRRSVRLEIALRYFFKASHLIRLRSFLSLHDVEFDLVAFFQAFVSVDLDRAVMHENVRPIIASNKAITFRVVKPLNLAFILSHELVPFLKADCGWGKSNLLSDTDAGMSALVFRDSSDPSQQLCRTNQLQQIE